MLEPSCVKIGRAIWYVGLYTKKKNKAKYKWKNYKKMSYSCFDKTTLTAVIDAKPITSFV